uniref:Uncharacterized protein n=1 Tax=Plectus sambesii TaxID=2011161 RepID=A0A914WDI6_9BILA
MPEGGWISRFFRYFTRIFAKPPAPITAAHPASTTHPPPAAKQLLKKSPPTPPLGSASVSTSSAPAAASSSSQVDHKSGMQTTIARFASQLAKVNKHTPQIKFLGPRKPQPKFDRSSLPSVAQASSDAKSLSSSSGGGSQQQKPVSSIGPVGKTPRGTGIDESELPAILKRRLPSAEEIAAINIGSAYGQ